MTSAKEGVGGGGGEGETTSDLFSKKGIFEKIFKLKKIFIFKHFTHRVLSVEQ